MSSNSPIFILLGVTKSRRDDNGALKTVLAGIDATVAEGSIVTLLGPSGAGKSTLLHLFNRLDEADSGSLLFKDKNIREWDVLSLRRQVGLVFQRPVMLTGTVSDNLLYGPRLRGQEPSRTPEQLLKMVGLESSYLQREARRLSVGEQHRVALARTLANGPSVLLLDEVTASLDPSAAREIERLIVYLKETLGLTVIWVTHEPEQARRVASEVWFLVSGKLILSEEKDSFFAGSHPLAAKFLSGDLKGGNTDE